MFCEVLTSGAGEAAREGSRLRALDEPRVCRAILAVLMNDCVVRDAKEVWLLGFARWIRTKGKLLGPVDFVDRERGEAVGILVGCLDPAVSLWHK
jgi:hypothetical protein